MKGRLLGLAVVGVAMAVMINAMALSQATISTAYSVSVVNTDSALLSVWAATSADADLTITTPGGRLTVVIPHGVQPGSTYKFSPALQIQNRSADAITLAYAFNAPVGLTIAVKKVSDDSALTSMAALSGPVPVYFELTAANDATLGAASTMTITATKVP